MGGTLAQVTNMVDLELAIRLETRQLWSITGAKKNPMQGMEVQVGRVPTGAGTTRWAAPHAQPIRRLQFALPTGILALSVHYQVGV